MRRAVLLSLLAACGGGGGATTDATPGGDGALASCSNPPPPESGDGTYYAADGTGHCSFDASPSDLMVAAMNAPDYATAAWCGACLDVTGPTGHVIVRVVDECPGCKRGDLDLSPQAFTLLSPLSAGRIPITWHQVACPVTGPIGYMFKDGSNAFWSAIQVRNHRYPIASLEARTVSGWHPLTRQTYNYFLDASGLGAGPYDLRITDSFGHVLEDPAIPFAAATAHDGAAQLPACP
jgi:expansin (peptidoglycan-binding protein)